MNKIFGNKRFNKLCNIYLNDPANPPANPPADPPSNPPGKMFTEQQVNDMMKESKKQLQIKNQELISQLETQKGLATTSEEMRKEIADKIEALKNESLTQEENYKRQLKNWETKYNTDVEKFKNESTSWQQRYTNSTIGRAIIDAANENKAYAPSQIEALLKPNTKLVEVVGVDGKPTGEFLPKVAFEDVDTEGKPIKVELTVSQAVKRMTELPQKFGNLFKSDATGGPSLMNNDNPPGNTPYSENMSMEAYAKNRDKILKSVK